MPPTSRFRRSSLFAGLLLFGTAAVALAAPATTLLVSRAFDGSAAVTAASLRLYGDSAGISADGRYVAFVSNAQNIAPGANGRYQVFLRDRVADTVELVSRSSAGEVGDRDSRNVAISGDGRYIAFSSDAGNLVPNDTNGQTDVFVRDRLQGTTQRVSVSSAGAEGDNWSTGHLAISATGRFVAFSSAAGTLTPAGWTGNVQVYLRDLAQSATEMVSVSTAGSPANADGYFDTLGVSSDGRYVAFGSRADNLVSGDTNGSADVFLRDRTNHATTRLSVTASGAEADGDSSNPAMSADGRYVVFATEAPNMVGRTGYSPSQVCLRDVQTGLLEIESETPQGVPGSDSSYFPGLSADGRYVVFASRSGDLIPGGNGTVNVYLRDRSTGVITRASEALGGGPQNTDANSWPESPAVSADGHAVLFTSSATNLIAADTNGRVDAFVRDRSAGVTQRVNDGPGGLEGEAPANCSGASTSADGRYVVYLSDANNLVPGDTNLYTDAFIWDRTTGAQERVSVSSGGAEANADVDGVSVSSDGRYVAFASHANNLVPGDQNQAEDVFVRDRLRGATERVSLSASGGEIFGAGRGRPAISADGRFVTFSAAGSQIVPGDRSREGVYVRDRVLGTTELISQTPNGDPINGGVLLFESVAISADGQVVAFASDATNLVPGDTNGQTDVFVRDRVAGVTERVSVDGAVQTDRISVQPSLSADGRFVAFTSYARNLVQPNFAGYTRIYVRDRLQGTLEIETLDAQGHSVYYGGFAPALSADGRWVSFDSGDSALVPGDTNNSSDVFLRDRTSQAIQRVSVAPDGSEVSGDPAGSVHGSVSGTGRFVAFSSSQPHLTADAPFGGSSIFERDRGPIGSVPAAPASLTATLVNPRLVRLAWSDQSTSEALFRIERSTDGGATWSGIGAAGAGVTVFLDGEIPSAATYQYRVRAANEDGDSAPSAPVTISTGLNLPGQPSGLSVTTVSDSSLRLSWTDGSTNETEFRIERATGGGSYSQISTAAANVTTYTDTNLGSNTGYAYRVRAHNADGDSAYTAPVTGTTAPLAPISLAATATSPRRVEISWTDPNSTPASVTIERSDDGLAWNAPVTVPAGTSTWADTSVQPRTIYRYRLRATGAGGTSGYAGPLAATTPPDPPAVPTGLHVTTLGDRQLRLDWTYTGPRVDAFSIERKSGTGDFTGINTVSASTTQYNDLGLTPNTSYSYRVRAVVGGLESEPSDAAPGMTWPITRGTLSVPRQLNFGTVRLGSSKMLTLTVRNTSRTDGLALVQADTTAPFSVDGSGLPMFIPARGSKTLKITFTPTQKGAARIWLTLHSSAPASPLTNVTLRGAGK